MLTSCSTTSNSSSEVVSSLSSSSVNSSISSSSYKNKEYSDEVLDIYRKYDKSFNPSTFKVNKIAELKNRDDFINGLDISYVQDLYDTGSVFKNHDNKVESIYKILKDNNINTVRVRIFNDIYAEDITYTNDYGVIYDEDFPGGEKIGKLNLENVTKMMKDAKEYGFKILLDFHYSDTWSDPGKQYLPVEWKDYSFEEVKNAIYKYTSNVINHLKNENIDVDYVQVGNEINSGMCFPHGKLDFAEKYDETIAKFSELFNSGAKAVRDNAKNAKIVFHVANGFNAYLDADNTYKPSMLKFFEDIEKNNVDYDILGSSFYTFYSPDTPVSTLTETMNTYVDKFNKPILMVEYSYAYTYEYGDSKTNYFWYGRETDYEVSIQGQADLIHDMIEAVAKVKNNYGLGTLYWGLVTVINKLTISTPFFF